MEVPSRHRDNPEDSKTCAGQLSTTLNSSIARGPDQQLEISESILSAHFAERLKKQKWRHTAKSLTLRIQLLRSELEGLKADNQTLHTLATKRIDTVHAKQAEQSKQVVEYKNIIQKYVETAAVLLDNRKLRQQVNEQSEQLTQYKHNLSEAQAALVAENQELHARLQALQIAHDRKMETLAAGHQKEVDALKKELEVELAEKERRLQRLEKGKSDIQGYLMAMGDYHAETTWKRRIKELKTENEALKEECRKYKCIRN